MHSTGLEAFDSTLQKTNLWLTEIMESLCWKDRHKAYVALGAALHALRDRLTVEEAVQLGAQLPTLVRGLYYEGWTPQRRRPKAKKADILDAIRDRFISDYQLDAEQVARGVFAVLGRHVSAGEMSDIRGILPRDIRDLLPKD